MPRIHRRLKRKSDGYSDEHINHLLKGTYFWPGHAFTKIPAGPGRDFTDYEALRGGWEALAGDLLPKFIADNPGHRPYAWWLFDAPERRLRTDGIQHPFDNRVRKQYVENAARTNPDFRVIAYKLYFGRPGCIIGSIKDDFEAKYESELAYLDRLGLLTDAERKAIYG